MPSSVLPVSHPRRIRLIVKSQIFVLRESPSVVLSENGRYLDFPGCLVVVVVVVVKSAFAVDAYGAL